MATTKWFPNFYCHTMGTNNMKTHSASLLQYTMLCSLNVFSHLIFIRVVSEVVSPFPYKQSINKKLMIKTGVLKKSSVFYSDGHLALRLALICTSLCVHVQSSNAISSKHGKPFVPFSNEWNCYQCERMRRKIQEQIWERSLFRSVKNKSPALCCSSNELFHHKLL